MVVPALSPSIMTIMIIMVMVMVLTVGTTMMMSAQCRLINNLADISDKAIPAKKERQEKWTPYQYHGSAHGINEMGYHVS